MRWVADECFPGSIVKALRREGHDVLFVAERYSGLDDEAVLDLANRENRLLLAHDADFGEKLFRRTALSAPGVVFMRIRDEPRTLRWPKLEEVIDL